MSFRWEIFIAKYSWEGKLNFNLTSLKKFTLELQKNHSMILQHTKSFTHEDCSWDTELLKKYWKIKRSNFIPKVSWSIGRKCPSYNLSKRKCFFCLNEKLEINSYEGNNLLSKRSELINKCRHLKNHVITAWQQGLVAKFFR